QAVLHYTAGKAAGMLSAEVVALAQEALPLFATIKVRLTMAVVLAMTMIAAGAGLLARQPVPNDAQHEKQPDHSASPAKSIPEKSQPRLDRFGDPLPAEAIARLGTIRFRHSANVDCVTYLPDGKLLASHGEDGTI